MNAAQKYNALNGKKVTKVQLEKLKEFAVNQLQQHIVAKIDKVLLDYPFYLFGDKGIIIKLTEKVKWVPTGTGLGAARHKGLAKEALNECGRLKPGYHYGKGGVILKSKSPARKPNNKVTRAKKVIPKKKNTAEIKLIKLIESKPSKSGKRKLFYPTINGRRLNRTNYTRKWEAKKLLTDFLNSKSEKEILEMISKSANKDTTKKKTNKKYDFIFEVSNTGGYVVKSFFKLPTNRSIKFIDKSENTNTNRYQATETGLKQLQKQFPNYSYGDKYRLSSVDLNAPKISNGYTKISKNVPKKEKNVPKIAKSDTSNQKSVTKKEKVGTQLGLFGSASIKVDSSHFAKMKVSELRKFTLDYYNKFLNGKKVLVDKSLHTIEFTTKGGRKIAKGGVMHKEKAAAIERFEELVKNSTYNNWGNRKASDKKDVLGFLNFKSKLVIDGVPKHLRISVTVFKNRKTLLKSYEVGKKETESTRKGLDKEPSVGGAKSVSKRKNTKNKPKPNKGLGSTIVLDSGVAPLPTKPAGVSGDSPAMVLDIPVTSPKVVRPDLATPKKKVMDNTPKKDLNLDGLVTGDELMQLNFETLDLSGKWAELMQEPAKNLRIAVYGKPKNGKTGACVDFASELAKHGTVLYNFADQGINKNTQDLWQMFGLHQNKNAELYGGRDLNKLESFIATGKFDFVIIDLVNAYIDNDNLKAADFESRFLKKYPNVSFIMILESTKSGDFKGEQKWMHLPDAVIDVEDFVMRNRGRYGAGEVVSWPEGLKKVNPKRYAELVSEKENDTPINENEILVLR